MMKWILIALAIVVFAGFLLLLYCCCKAASYADRSFSDFDSWDESADTDPGEEVTP